MDRIEPAEPIDRIDPLDPMLKMEPEEPGARDEPAEIRITTFWQAEKQPRTWGLSAATWPHRAGGTRTERQMRTRYDIASTWLSPRQ
jgi:hypothetical protein